MKIQTIFISLLVTIIFILSILLGTRVTLNNQQPSDLFQQSITLPEAAKFVPKNSYLTIHFKINLNKIDNYIEPLTNKDKKSIAINNINELRDGLFSLIGLDFKNDLSSWIGSDLSFSVFNAKESSDHKEWLLITQSINEQNTKDFIDRFLRNQTNTGGDVKKINYKDQEIFSAVRPNSDSEDNEISMVLLEDDQLLISSNKEIIIEAISTSKDTSLNQLHDKELKELISTLEDGMALITASPKALELLFKTPKEITTKLANNSFVGSIRTKGKDISLNSIFNFKQPFIGVSNQSNQAIEMIKNIPISSKTIAIISEPKEILQSSKANIYSQWLGPVVNNSLSTKDSNIKKAIFESSTEPLIYISQEDSWIIESTPDLDISNIEEILKKNNYEMKKILTDNHELEVWYTIALEEINDIYKINPKVSLIVEKAPNKIKWSNEISNFENKLTFKKDNPIINTFPEIQNHSNLLTHQIYLDQSTTKKVLKNWKPWQLLKAISTKSTDSHIQRLSLALGTYDDNQETLLNFQAQASLN
ncbi:DUF3352 domain-containing protein [Prochlorococcus marinus]|uniref:DUF3352 domain-containing protein n=1 Tax=Prochlorococcus marinus TaxID=1219 RepID=UPI0022B3CA2C|nr:DUF3352 domain-containing protein [Prochlorococcus marinus]